MVYLLDSTPRPSLWCRSPAPAQERAILLLLIPPLGLQNVSQPDSHESEQPVHLRIYYPVHRCPLFTCGNIGRFCTGLNLSFFASMMEETRANSEVIKPPMGWLGALSKCQHLLPLPPPPKYLLSALHLLPEPLSLSFHSITAPGGVGAHTQFLLSASSSSLLSPSATTLHSLVVLFPQTPQCGTCSWGPRPQSPSFTISIAATGFR